ncbi:MAG TPA: substrate-binding protein [Acetobacteraceae bacterium]|nr:substrate-binding protein [Acetobacteraceae bacterium]
MGSPSRSMGTRRALLRGTASLAGAAVLPALPPLAKAEDKPPLGTWPAGSSGSTVFVGLSVPRTGTYAVPGDDELKGFELALEHINNGHQLMKQIATGLTKGLLGKKVEHGVADSEAKPNTAVQNGTNFINNNKAVLIAGCVSSAEAVAMNKLAQREHVIYLPGVSGSNDTTGKDCVRYSFRQCFYAQTAAAALTPVIIKQLGKNKKIAFLTPDYTYGHTVRQSFEDSTKAQGGWTVATNQVCPLGASDYSSYLLNIANSGADVFININFGNDAIQSIKQAKEFGVLEKMTLVVAYNTPFLARDVTPELMQGVYASTDFWWTLEDKYPLAKQFVAAFEEKYHYKPDWSANSAYMQLALWADAVTRAGSFYPPDVIKAYEAGKPTQSTVGEVQFRPEDHQLIRPVIIQRGKKKSDMKNPDDYYEIVEIVPGGPLMQKPDAFGCHLGDYA